MRCASSVTQESVKKQPTMQLRGHCLHWVAENCHLLNLQLLIVSCKKYEFTPGLQLHLVPALIGWKFLKIKQQCGSASLCTASGTTVVVFCATY